MLELVRDAHLNKPFRTPAKVAPIEFVFIGLLVAVHMDTLSLPQLSCAIGMMRDDVRRQHVDIRMNARVARSMVEFVQGVEAGKLKGVASGGEAAGISVGRKRKRDLGDSEVVKKKRDLGDSEVVKKEIAGPSDLMNKHRPPSFAAQSTATITTSTGAPGVSLNRSGPADRLAAIRNAKKAVDPSSRQPVGSSAAHQGLQSPNNTPISRYQPERATQQRATHGSLEESLMASMGLAGRGLPPPPPPPASGGHGGRWIWISAQSWEWEMGGGLLEHTATWIWEWTSWLGLAMVYMIVLTTYLSPSKKSVVITLDDRMTPWAIPRLVSYDNWWTIET
jgi:hypothetical protein